MKIQISRDSFQPGQRYSGVYLQQGRMILDADWNELTDIQKARLSEALRDAIASGAPRSGGLAISFDGTAVRIEPGTLYVDGVPAALATADQKPVTVLAQPAYPLPQPVKEAYLEKDLRFYADVWERSVTALQQDQLRDAGLHGADTATRSQTMLQVKWCDKSLDPLAGQNNPPIGDAALSLQLRLIASSGDPCDPCASQVAVDERIGNYLFRVEVHDYDPTTRWLTLKWSRDNGAEAAAAGEMPPGFGQGDWVWEFFDEDSERLLGNHPFRRQDWVADYYGSGGPDATAFVAKPSKLRGILRAAAALPPTNGLTPGAVPTTWVRQWDGFLRINLGSKALFGLDRGVKLFAGTIADQTAGRVFLNDTLDINLERLRLSLNVKDRRFVAGDYWLADVREARDDSGEVVLNQAPPRGVRHHYLFLGELAGSQLSFGELDATGKLVANSADAYRRRMHFPALTDLHADEIGFIDRCGKLFEGAQNVQQALDNLCHISARDIAFIDDCGKLYDGADNVQDALDELCNIAADDIAYRLPECADKNSIRALLAKHLPTDGKPATIEIALDALLCALDAASLPYPIPDCVKDDSVGGRLGFKAGEGGAVGPVLDRLLCQFTAQDLPLDKSDAALCAKLKTDGIDTVQDALDLLCQTPSSCAITVAVGQLDGILRQFASDKAQTDLHLCLLPGEHVIAAPLEITGKASLRLTALSASAARIRLKSAPTVLEAGELSLEGLGWLFDGNATLTLRGRRISSQRGNYLRSATAPKLPAMVQLQAWTAGLKIIDFTPELFWRDNTMSDTWQRYVEAEKTVFTPDITGEILIADKIRDLLGDPVTLVDQPAFDAGIRAIAEAVAAMPASAITTWSNKLAAGSGVATTPASNSAISLLGNTTTRVSRSNLGAPSIEAAKPMVAAAVTRMAAAAGDVAAISELLADAIRGSTIERGFGVALALADNLLSGSLCDNHIEGELLLMNGLTNGIDPRDLGVNKRQDEGHVVAGKTGNLSLSGNRLERLWSLLPAGSIVSNTMQATLPGYESLSLTGNQLAGYGHSVVAALLTVHGNRVLNGSPKGPTYIGKCFANSAVLSANAASFADEFTPLLVVASQMQNAANLMLVDQV